MDDESFGHLPGGAAANRGRRRPAPAAVSAAAAAALSLGLWLGASLAPVRCARAQEGAEPRLQQLQETFKKPSLSVGALFQSVADFQIDRTGPGHNGFSVANFRLALYGDLDAGFGYFLQANFVGTPAILDARLKYRPGRFLAFDFGQFKVPFSKEFLTGAGGIDFVNRSQVVTALAPGRQIGIGATLANEPATLRLTTGAFNGNAAAANGNDNDRFLYAARASAGNRVPAADIARVRFETGVSAACSRDAAASRRGKTSRSPA